MRRIATGLLITLLLVGQAFFAYQWREASERLSLLERELGTTSFKLRKQERYTRSNLERLGASLTAATQVRRTVAPQAPGTTVSKQALAELLIIESARLDKLVDWVDLIEDKMYFLIFSPADATDREAASRELQGRSEVLRAQFADLAGRAADGRNRIFTQDAGSKGE